MPRVKKSENAPSQVSASEVVENVATNKVKAKIFFNVVILFVFYYKKCWPVCFFAQFASRKCPRNFNNKTITTHVNFLKL